MEATSIAWALPRDSAPRPPPTLWSPARSSPPTASTASSPTPPEAPRLESLTLLAPAETVDAAAGPLDAEAQNRARDLQSTPANFATPTDLAERAEEIAAGPDALSVEVLGRAELEAKGMGGLLAVSRGGPQEPRLIVLRYAAAAPAPPSASSARVSPSTPAASRSSPAPACRR